MIERLVAIRVTDPEALAEARRAIAAHPDGKRRVLTTAREAGGSMLEEAALLATCERLELYGVASGPRTDEYVHGSQQMFHTDAILHGAHAAQRLLRVAAGLESRIVGETHVLGQVAAAYREASELFAAGPALRTLFESAVRVGRRVRNETELGRLAGSYVSATTERVKGIATDGAPPRIAVLGSGALARQLLTELRGAGFGKLTLFARHIEHVAAEVADTTSVRPLTVLSPELSTFDVVIAATSSSRALVTAADVRGLGRRSRLLTFIDLGMPTNIDANVMHESGVRLVALHDLAGPAHSAHVLVEANEIVRRELDRLTGKLMLLGQKRRAVA